MAYDKATKNAVRRGYVSDRKPLEQAAKAAGVPFTTARRWKSAAAEQGDDWDKVRTAMVIAGSGIEDVARSAIAGFLLQYQSTMDALNSADNVDPLDKVQMLSSLADAFNKTISASRRVLPETSRLATAMEVVQKLTTFLLDKHPQHAAALVDVLEPFGQELARVYG